jgi:hypothetical protein
MSDPYVYKYMKHNQKQHITTHWKPKERLQKKMTDDLCVSIFNFAFGATIKISGTVGEKTRKLPTEFLLVSVSLSSSRL